LNENQIEYLEQKTKYLKEITRTKIYNVVGKKILVK